MKYWFRRWESIDNQHLAEIMSNGDSLYFNIEPNTERTQTTVAQKKAIVYMVTSDFWQSNQQNVELDFSLDGFYAFKVDRVCIKLPDFDKHCTELNEDFKQTEDAIDFWCFNNLPGYSFKNISRLGQVDITQVRNFLQLNRHSFTSHQNSLIIHNTRFEHIGHYGMLPKGNLIGWKLVKLDINSTHPYEVWKTIRKAIRRIPKTVEVHLNISIVSIDWAIDTLKLADKALDLSVSKVFLHVQKECLLFCAANIKRAFVHKISELKWLTDVEFTINSKFDTKLLRNIHERRKTLEDFKKLLYYVFLNEKVPTHNHSPLMVTKEVEKIDVLNEYSHLFQDKSISFKNIREGNIQVLIFLIQTTPTNNFKLQPSYIRIFLLVYLNRSYGYVICY